MNVLLISQCSKNALAETRRILDQFAERRGDRTWQTPITQAGLTTLRKLLRKTARKNTAVACHWIRGKDHSELLWIVGDSRRFNAEGAVPTNTTRRNILRSEDENDWHTAEDIKLLAALASLLHDLGKACSIFQARLKGEAEPGRNRYRHEWISLRLFQAFVGNSIDEDWLKRLMDPSAADREHWLKHLERDGLDSTDGRPFEHLPPLAAAIGWLVLTHHRLPTPASDQDVNKDTLVGIPGLIDSEWNQPIYSENEEAIEPYWQFDGPLPVEVSKWQVQAAKYAERLLERLGREPRGWLANPYVMHLSRLSLMLSDHHYSSLTEPGRRVKGQANYPLFANTNRKTGQLCQQLDEHLLGVAKVSRQVSHHLPSLARNLPHLGRHKGFRQRSGDKRFRWQDHAFDLAESLRDKADRQGFFGINMASTGCGKTLANGRILYALANPKTGPRFSIALGLRTLTLQTGQAYRDRLNLGDDQLAVRVGGSASRKLFEHFEAEAEKTGSASSQSLMEEDSHVVFEGNPDHPLLDVTAHDERINKLISAPLLVCTVDHLMPATEGARGGRQIAPMLRLLSSDLVLDEIDDFDLDDLPALTRLVHWAGLLGTKVLLSSATLPPALVTGLYRAYRAGREEFQRNRGETGAPLNICCAWFDEHGRQHSDCSDSASFQQAHKAFAAQRHQQLAKEPVRRRGDLLVPSLRQGAPEALRESLASDLLNAAQQLHHAHHAQDSRSGKRVSFGLIRMANIEPLVEVARYLFHLGASEGIRIHLCVYHSQFPLLLRSAIERRLDQALNRKEPNAVFDLPDIRQRLDAHPEDEHLFVVLGSPVTEVGRDHDYDWAIVEPSSMRSLIQLAGRVRRHRFDPCHEPNILLLSTNLRAMGESDKPAFTRPGFEGNGKWRLTSHDLTRIMDESEREIIDARPRIVPHEPLRPRSSLVDLEHARLQDLMIEPETKPLSAREQKALGRTTTVPPMGAYSWYTAPKATLTAVLQRWKPFRNDNRPQCDLVLLPDEDDNDFILHRVSYDSKERTNLYTPVSNLLDREQLPTTNTAPWGETDYMEALDALAEEMDMPLERCAETFGVLSLDERQLQNGWKFHPALGFTRNR